MDWTCTVGGLKKTKKKKEDPKESERNSYMYAISTIAFLFPPSEVHPPHTYSPSASHSKGISNTRLSRSSLTRLTMAASGEGSSLSRSKKWTFFGRGGKRWVRDASIAKFLLKTWARESLGTGSFVCATDWCITRTMATVYYQHFCISLFTADAPRRARLPISPSAALPSCLWSLRISPPLLGSRGLSLVELTVDDKECYKYYLLFLAVIRMDVSQRVCHHILRECIHK